MANEEQLAILRQGWEVWNTWRQGNPKIEPDLREADLRGAFLTRAFLERAFLQRADLRGANLEGAFLRGANLQEAFFSQADLRGAFLSGADLRGAFFFKADLYVADLRGANLEGASLTRVDLRGANLERANLQEADLRGANLEGANLQEADLRGANLEESNLTRADLTRANFEGANLQEADLTRAEITRADFTDARVGFTVFGSLDLSAVRGLDTLRHALPSTIGIDTIYRSGGNISEVFLKNAGVPDTFIEYMHSLTVRPIEYYSCFISYSSKDHDCAERLHSDLQSRGVRCWFAPHDMEIGKPIVRGIDEAIRIYDKLLIILSEASVTSHWVGFEVDQALHREIEQGRTMLFPIRLDDAVLNTTSNWAVQLRSRHIGDFRRWKEHDTYQVTFRRLLRDLAAKE